MGCNKLTSVCVARKLLHQIEIMPCEGAMPVDRIDLGKLALF